MAGCGAVRIEELEARALVALVRGGEVGRAGTVASQVGLVAGVAAVRMRGERCGCGAAGCAMVVRGVRVATVCVGCEAACVGVAGPLSCTSRGGPCLAGVIGLSVCSGWGRAVYVGFLPLGAREVAALAGVLVCECRCPPVRVLVVAGDFLVWRRLVGAVAAALG